MVSSDGKKDKKSRKYNNFLEAFQVPTYEQVGCSLELKLPYQEMIITAFDFKNEIGTELAQLHDEFNLINIR